MAFELSEVVLESVKLSWADKSEILRVEEKNDVFGAFELVEREIFDDLAVDYGAGIKRRGKFSYNYLNHVPHSGFKDEVARWSYPMLSRHRIRTEFGLKPA